MRKIRGFATGLRNGSWSQTKYTNLTQYSPYSSEIRKIVKENHKLPSINDKLLIKTYKAKNGLIHPINEDDIRKVLHKIPSEFLMNLRAIYLCSGSEKQKNYSNVRFGTYHDYYKTIFLHPFPESKCIQYDKKPKPSISLEYERHGAIWYKEGKGWNLQFDIHSLRSLYLKDVLIHEIGHHVENISHDIKHKSYAQREKFADWFALEYGMKKK
ncbi:hypothetical protein [Bacillus solimangrovi]|uniref:Uncharacterized protein n=1 Tax=Bacillus solimangrovi TaxID=1305675 RepID=A0A1E5LE76_9BACI|nr:hypothetical protein [Bacillus solimangrovi]OEH92354.1 hypothetical protein BFG57_16395 [Bacillus solimangrovi]